MTNILADPHCSPTNFSIKRLVIEQDEWNIIDQSPVLKLLPVAHDCHNKPIHNKTLT